MAFNQCSPILFMYVFFLFLKRTFTLRNYGNESSDRKRQQIDQQYFLAQYKHFSALTINSLAICFTVLWLLCSTLCIDILTLLWLYSINIYSQHQACVIYDPNIWPVKADYSRWQSEMFKRMDYCEINRQLEYLIIIVETVTSPQWLV